jgi:general secretion pathway protein L
MNPVAHTVSRFFSWWFGELAACVPERVRRRLRRNSSLLVITPTNGAVDLTLHRAGRTRRLGQILHATESASRHALSDLLAGISLRHFDVVVNVPADKVLRRSVGLPLEAAENLREVLAFEMDRNTPFKASEVAYDYRVTATDTTAKKLTIDLAVVPRTMLEEAASIANCFGLTANRIGIAGDDPRWDRSVNFRPYEDSCDPPPAQRSLLLALTITAAVLALVAWYLPLYFDHQTSAAYEARLERTRAAAMQAENLKRRLTNAINLSRVLINRRASTPTVTSLLADVTDRLPDDTWLTQLRLQDGKLTVTGFSPSTAALIAPLDASPLLTEVRFGSPVTADPQVGGESFNILARVALDPGS